MKADSTHNLNQKGAFVQAIKSTLKRRVVGSLSAAILMGAVTSAAQANNPQPQIKADAPNRYVVKKGDTLWDISGRYLTAPWQWRDIWAANKQVKNPHLIYPGDILLMCLIKGETLIGIDTGEGCVGIEHSMTQTASSGQRVTIKPLEDSIPPIPLSTIENWLGKVSIVNPSDYRATPYVIASKTGNLITGHGDKIYAKGVALVPGQRYGIYRESKPYVDPKTKQIIGLEVQQVAAGQVTNVATNGVSSIALSESYGSEVREGDRVFIETGAGLPPVFYPKAGTANRGGQIVRVMDSIASAGAGSVVAVNLGTNNGVSAGDVFTLYKRGALVRDIKDNDMPVRLPSEQAGHLMVFKPFDKISYAYVLDSELALNIGDRLLPPSK